MKTSEKAYASDHRARTYVGRLQNERSMAHASMWVIPFAGEHAHLLDATDKVRSTPPRVLHFSAFHVS